MDDDLNRGLHRLQLGPFELSAADPRWMGWYYVFAAAAWGPRYVKAERIGGVSRWAGLSVNTYQVALGLWKAELALRFRP